ncbi:MAG: thioredoxin family protein [Deltaproteobacteria bacterium]|nr:thioredoxin family protein [Deltaproteobacteria bacterium]
MKKTGPLRVLLLVLVLAAASHLAAAGAASGSDLVHWLSYDQAKAQMVQAGKPVLIFFHLTYCGRCQKMERLVFSDPAFAAKLNQEVLPVMVDMDKEKPLGEEYHVDYIPTHVLLSPEGKEIYRDKGVVSLEKMNKMVDWAVSGAYRTKPFQAFYPGD